MSTRDRDLFRMTADDAELSHLLDVIVQLRRDYERQAKPYVERIVAIENRRVRPLVVVRIDALDAALARTLGGTPA